MDLQFKAIRDFSCQYRKLYRQRNLAKKVNFACLGAIALQFNGIICSIGL